MSCQFDANGEAGIYWNGAFECSATGCNLSRNGVNVSSGSTLVAESCHISINASFNILHTALTSAVYSDGAVFGPVAFVKFVVIHNKF